MFSVLQGGTPSRIVCLCAEGAEILYRLDAWDRIVGITTFFEKPVELPARPIVSGFSKADLGKIAALLPDLVITFSDVQATLAADLIRLGLPVLALNYRTLAGVVETILLLGRLIDRAAAAQALASEFQNTLQQLRFRPLRRPRIYFEEWPDPLISGIGWVTELIEIAGGTDIFATSSAPKAENRIHQPEEIVQADPEIIVASWCGKPFDAASMRGRPGWDRIHALQARRVYEIPGADILQAGPRLLHGLSRLREIILQWEQESDCSSV